MEPTSLMKAKEQERLAKQALLAGPIDPTRMGIDHEYFQNLTAVPQSTLIRLITEYHRLMVEHGHADATAVIAQHLQELIQRQGLDQGPELIGMELLLKDGFLPFLLRVGPFIPKLRSQIVKFKDVSVTAQRVVKGHIDTVLTKIQDLFLGLVHKHKVVDVPVLQKATGYLMPGTMTLVLGPPGCGKATLLKSIAGRIHTEKGVQLSGSVTYNNHDISKFIPARLAAMSDEADIHLGLLTVRETLWLARMFSQSWGPQTYSPKLKEVFGDALALGQDPKLEVILHLLSLAEVANKPVGNAQIPSLSPSERHRVTAAEMLAGQHGIYVFDELNKGVDSAVTYETIEALRLYCRMRQTSMVVSLLQPSPEVYDLFDRVVLMSSGHIIFQGNLLDARPYFTSLGFEKPDYLEPAEFLCEVASKDGWAYLKPGFPRLSSQELARAFEQSLLYRDICRVVDSPDLYQVLLAQVEPSLALKLAEGGSVGSENAGLEKATENRTAGIQTGDRVLSLTQDGRSKQYVEGQMAQEDLEKLISLEEPVLVELERKLVESDELAREYESEYLRSRWEEMRLLTWRTFQVFRRNKFLVAARIFQVMFLGFFTGFCLFQAPSDATQDDMNLRRSINFVGIIVNTLLALSQLPGLFEERAIFYKQHAARFYRPLSFLVSLFVAGLPFSLIEATIYTILVYFLTGLSLDDNGQHFWVYYVIIVLVTIHASSMVRFLGMYCSQPGIAAMLGAALISTGLLMSGFLVSRFKVPPYYIWLYYINPLQWGITGLLINEFSSHKYTSRYCSQVANVEFVLPQCVGRQGLTGGKDWPIGEAWLAKGQFLVDPGWIAVSVSVLISWIIVWNFLAYLAIVFLRYNPPIKEGTPPPPPPKEGAEEKEPAVQAQEVDDLAAKGRQRFQKFLSGFVPVTLTWHDLAYELDVQGMKKTVLARSCGWASPGEMLAVLGASGSGQKTFIDILAGRFTDPASVRGRVLVNGFPKEPSTFGRVLGYVDRADAYWPFMTVREALYFSAALRVGGLSLASRNLLVEDVLDVMELSNLRQRLVVSLISGSTPELSKRLCIAVELAANPSILFLDEWSSGLDNSSALRLAACLKSIAGMGRTVVASLHFPSARLVSFFDRCHFLKRGGTCVYFGPLGTDMSLLKSYFEGLPGVPLCPAGVNVVSYVLELIGDGNHKRGRYKRDFEFEYRVSDLCVDNKRHLTAMLPSGTSSAGSPNATLGPQLEAHGYAASLPLQMGQVLLRQQRQYFRNVGYSWGRLCFMTLLGIFVGSIYWQENYLGVPGMNARAGQIFASCVFFAIANAQAVAPHINAARPAYMREQATKSYNPYIYNLSWGFAEIPYLLVMSLVYASITCGMTGLAVSSVGQFFLFWFILFEFVLAITFLGMLLSFAVPIAPVASIVVSIVVSCAIPTGGLVIIKRKLKNIFRALFWMNPLQYALNAMTSTAFFCDTNGPLCKNNGLNAACTTSAAACPDCHCPRLNPSNTFVWDQLSYNRSLDHSRVGLDMMALFLFVVLFRLSAGFALRYLKWNRRY